MSQDREENKQNRWSEIRDVHKRYSAFYEMLRGSVVVAVLLVIGAYIFIDQVTDFSMNAFTEAIGVIGTAFILDRVYQRRAERERKEELIFRLGSEENILSKGAARMLELKGWLQDGSLKDAKLTFANLKGARLIKANFKESLLYDANLEGSGLLGANLQSANLHFANLKGALLIRANLKGSYLVEATLTEADLTRSNLEGSFLIGADVSDAILIDATLPDGTKWTDDTDMKRFTDPEHDEFEETFKTVQSIYKNLGSKIPPEEKIVL